jgi:hypothetical protein
VWQRLGETHGLRPLLALYAAGVLVLAYAGGSDLFRFMPYLMPLLIAFLAITAARGLAAYEVVYVLVALLLYHRLLGSIPMAALDDYLNYLTTHWDRVNVPTLLRLAEAGIWLAGAHLLRACMQRRARRRATSLLASAGAA